MSYINSARPNGFYLKKEFIKWLRGDQSYTPGSSNSYASYVANANKTILSKYLEDDIFFELIREAVNKLDKANIEELIDHLIGIVIIEAPATVIYKYKNGLLQYRNFLIETLSGDDIIEEAETLPMVIKEIAKKRQVTFLKNVKFPHQLIYDKDSLKKIFIFRMLTQDRCYGNVYFIISFLKKLFYKEKLSKKFFDDYIINQINNIQLHTNGGTITLADIKSLTIAASSYDEVDITVILNNNSQSLLYTKRGFGDTKTPMNVFALRSIAIDHIFPMKMILKEQEAALPTLKRITEAFRSFHGPESNERIKGKMIKEIGNQLLNAAVFNLDDIELLKKEMIHINGFIELQLVDGAENLLKKAKFERSEEKKSPIN